MLQTGLGAHLRGRLDPRMEGVTRWRVLPGDLDLFGHMNNSRYLAIMDLARVDFLIRVGLLPDLIRNRWTTPVGSAHLDFRDSLRLFEVFEVGTRLVYWDDTWFYLRQEFRRASSPKRPVGTGYVRTIVRGPQGNVAPDEVLKTMAGDLASGQRPELTDDIRHRFFTSEVHAGPPRAAATPPREPIAIVGAGCRLPGGVEDPGDLWQLLVEGREVIVDIPDDRWDATKFYDPSGKSRGRTYVQRAGLLEHDLRAFDASFFGINPREAAVLDPQQRLLLEVSWEAMEDAGVPPTSLAGSRTGVFMGGFTLDNLLLQMSPDNRELLDAPAATSSTLTMFANRLSYFYDLRGPSISMDTACSSSLVATHVACQSIWSGESEAALVGGASALLWPEIQIMMSKGKFLSPRGRCHSFSDEADGYVRAEGAVVLLLKPLSAALRDGNRVRAVILGTASNQDGRTNGITVPNADAQIDVMRTAYANAGVDPRRVVYIEAHGTGTPVGDPIEARAIGAVLGASRGAAERCRMGSLKANVGHTEAAAGVAGVLKAMLCLEHGAAPPHPHLGRPNPEIPLDALGLHIPTTAEPLPRGDGPRVAGVNGFGYGGANAHIVLAEAPAVSSVAASARVAERPLLLALSAKAPDALAPLAERYADWIEAGRTAPEALCRSAAVHRSHHRHRLAVRADSHEALAGALRAFSRGERDAAALHLVAEPPEARQILFVYTGMGPQWAGMGRELMDTEPVFRDAVHECDAFFRAMAGFSIAAEMTRDEASSRMARTEVAQPANTVLQIALTRLWASWGVTPDAVIGHSIGEVGAAFASGAIGLRDALAVAYHRSRLQQRLAGRGGMLAVELAPDEAQRCVERHGPGISVAAINSARSVTLAGEQAALDRVAAELAAAGAFHRFLRVEVPYHSPLMDALHDELIASLADITPRAPRVRLYSTVHGRRMGDERHDARYWCQNMSGTVFFADALREAIRDGHGAFVEIGPHPVLASSIREGLDGARTRGVVIASLTRKQPERAAMTDALGQLYAAGATIAWRAYFGPGAYSGAPTYPWQRRIHWQESARSSQRRHGSTGHPMLLDADAGPPPRWTTELNLGTFPFLADHEVAGSLLFPGAGYVELALAARRALTGDARCSLEDLDLKAAIVLREGESPRVAVSMSADSPVVHIHHQEADGQQPIACARGKLFSAGRQSATVDVGALAGRLADETPAELLYELLGRRGLRYGPAFRAVERLRRGPGEVLAWIRLPESVDERGYHLHPVLLDAAFHSLIAAAEVGDGHDVVPVAIRRVHFFASPGRSLIAHGRLAVGSGGTFSGDITLFGEDGAVLAEVTGLECRTLPRATADAGTRLAQRLYARSWERVALTTRNAEAASWLVLGGPLDEATRERGVPTHADTTVRHVRDVGELVAAAASLPANRPVRVLDLRWSAVAQSTNDPVHWGTEAAAALLETLTSLTPPRIDRYFLVTACAEAVPSSEGAPSLGHAPLLGLARTAMTERPDLRLTLVDLDAPPSRAEELLPLLGAAGTEQELAVRGGDAFAARLLRTTLPEPAANRPPPLEPAPEGRSCALELGEVGRLDTLGFVACERSAPGPGEIEIEVEVVALGFKDVMKALGMLSERVTRTTYIGASIGMEGAGRVSAVGEGVTDLAVGDRVYGVAPAFLRSHVVLPATQAVKLPDQLSYEQGANLIAFLTVYWGLVRVARLGRGETILIHGATGGVGLAAIELARARGATVFATAGSEEKRDYLRAIGIEHVSNSRDVAFADDVRAWTGGRGVDVVLNLSPGEIMTKGVACLAPLGRFIELGKGSFEKDAALNLLPFNESLTYAALDFDRMMASKIDDVHEMCAELMELFRQGALRPVPSTTWPASQVEDAFRTMARGKHIGKVCIAMRDPELRLRRSARAARLSADATYLVTGGLGGFGLEVARWMADEGAKHLVLVSRRGAPSDDAAIAALRARGVDVRPVAADVSRLSEVERVLADIRGQMPPLRGIVHSAAVLDDRPLDEIDRGALDRVMAPKARGAWNLHVALEETPLDFLLLFSSVSALIGNARQGNYVAANAFLDELALYRRRQGLAATSVQWGALGEAGMVARDDAVARHLEQLGLRGLTTSDALFALGRVLDGAPERVAIADADFGRLSGLLPAWAGQRRLSALIEHAGAGDGGAPAEQLDEATFGGLDEEGRSALVEAKLTQVIAKVMRIPVAEIDPAQPLRELGMDSIVALEIAAKVKGELSIGLPSMEVARGPSVRELAAVLLAQLPRAAGPASEAPLRLASGM